MIYLVERTDRPDYDECDAIVVRAGSRTEALNLVLHGNPVLKGEPLYGFRLDGSNAKVTAVGPIGQPEIILSSHL